LAIKRFGLKAVPFQSIYGRIERLNR